MCSAPSAGDNGVFIVLAFDLLTQQHQREEEEGTDDDDSDDDYVEFFTSVVDMGEENLRQFIAEARNNPDTLREFMIRFL